MKNIIIILIFSILCCGCKKTWDADRTYTIQGYLILTKEEGATIPVRKARVGLSQEEDTYKPSDPVAITDDNGYFKLEYKPHGKEKKVSLYPAPKDVSQYNCIFDEYMPALEKGKDLDVGQILLH